LAGFLLKFYIVLGIKIAKNNAVKKTLIIKILISGVVILTLGFASIFVFHDLFGFTSSNSAFYLLRGKKGGIEITRDLLLEDADRLIFMLDANCIFNYFMRGIAYARGRSLLELSWDRETGRGDIKQYKKDGTIITISFSRFTEDSGIPQGLFLGGNLPYGDPAMSPDETSSGFGYFDGNRWNHIWCSANEGFNLTNTNHTIVPPLWKYEGSKVIKNRPEEVILESEHSAQIEDISIKMKRLVQFKAEDDFFTLRIKFTNASTKPITYGYAYGDEPWLGNYGASEGDVGWDPDGIIKYEKFISPSKRYAGFWDIGNDAIGEKRGSYTGYANFIEWVEPQPSYVFFSNALDNCCTETLPLFAKHNRVINIVWLNQLLMPGESKEHVLIIGKAIASPDSALPQIPNIDLQ